MWGGSYYGLPLGMSVKAFFDKIQYERHLGLQTYEMIENSVKESPQSPQ
jgi:hypothetical protein